MRDRTLPRYPLPRVILAGLAVLLVLTVVTAGVVHVLRGRDARPQPPIADARGARLGPGPPPTAYPWPGAHAHAQDPWGFTKRQCTSYAAWYLNSHGVPFAERTRGPAGVATFARASGWADAAAQAGFTVTATPTVGSVAHWRSGEGGNGGPTAGCDGHVAIVIAVAADGRSVRVAEYDGQRRCYQERTTRAPRYLRIGGPPAVAGAGG